MVTIVKKSDMRSGSPTNVISAFDTTPYVTYWPSPALSMPWRSVPSLCLETDYDLARNLDCMAALKRVCPTLRLKVPDSQKVRAPIRPQNPYKVLREKCIKAGLTYAQTKKKLSEERKRRRTWAYYTAQGSRQHVPQRNMFAALERDRLLNSHVPKNNFVNFSWSKYVRNGGKKKEHAVRVPKVNVYEQRRLVTKQRLYDFAQDAEIKQNRKMRASWIFKFVDHKVVKIEPDWVRVEDIAGDTLPGMKTCFPPIYQKVLWTKYPKRQDPKFSDIIYGNMDEHASAQGSKEESLDSKSNTVMVDDRGKSVASSIPKSKSSYVCLSALSGNPSAKETSDRFLTIYQGKWTKNDATNKLLVELDLPKFVFQNFSDSPNMMLFNQHVYWHGDMKIRIVVNSNQRQYGQLQARFYYGAKAEMHFDFKKNIYSGSQMPHCLISANDSNIGELIVPYEFIRPLIVCKPNAHEMYNECDIGTFLLSVLVPLNMAPNTQTSCSYAIQIAFENNLFAGLINKDIPVAQGLITDIVKEANSFLNMDQPSSIQMGQVMIPQNCSSWANGLNNAPYNNILRLDPSALMPYGEGRIPAIDEMKVLHICQVFGIVKILDWKATQIGGTLLHSFDAAPEWKDEDYPRFDAIQDIRCMIVPPITVISNLFSYWRGSLRLRIDIVGAADLTGRLLVCYVPRGPSTITMKQAVGCMHAVYDLQEKRQFVFDIPFISDKMLWPRYRSWDRAKTKNQPPGRVYIFVYNDLIYNNTIPPNCKLVLYFSAGPDFEVAVPCAPSFGLSFNTQILYPDAKVKEWAKFKSGYYPTYTGDWRYFGSGAKLIMRYHEVSDQITQMDVSKLDDVKFKVMKPLRPFVCKYWKNSTETGTITRFAIWYASGSPEYIYFIPFETTEQASEFCKLWASGSDPSSKALNYYSPGTWCYPEQMTFIIDEDANTVYGNMDERSSITTSSIKPVASACSTSFGKVILGESFSDLKDYCRRYQRYYSDTVEVDPSKFANFDVIQLRFPAMPQGLDLNIGTVGSGINEYWNRTRDGPIPIIASGFKFFTGGLRFRVIISAYDAESGVNYEAKLLVQHRPGTNNDTPYVRMVNPNWLESNDLELPGFASHIQMEKVNQIVSVEVPFYLPSIRGYLQRPTPGYDSAYYHSLGEVVIQVKIENKKKFNFKYEIYYALADDSRFSVFQGFPPVFDLIDINDLKGFTTLPKIPRLTLNEPIQKDEVSPTPYQLFIKKYNLKEGLFEFTSVYEIIPLFDQNFVESHRAEPFKWVRRWDNYKYPESPLSENFPFMIYVHSVIKHKLKNHNKYRNELLSNTQVIFEMIQKQFPDVNFKMSIVIGNMLEQEEDVNQTFPKLFINPKVNVNYSKMKSVKGNGIWRFFNNVGSVAENLSKIDPNPINLTFNNTSSLTQQASDFVNNFSIPSDSSSIGEGFLSLFDLKESDFKNSSIFESLKERFENAGNNLFSIILNLLSCIFNPCLMSFSTAFVNILLNLKLISITIVAKLVSHMQSFIRWLMGWQRLGTSLPNEPCEGSASITGQSSEDDTALASYVSTVVAGVAGALNFAHSITAPKRASLGKILLKDLKDFAMTSNHLFTFVRNNIEMVKSSVEFLYEDHPSCKNLAYLQEHGDDIFNWAKEVMILTDMRKRETLFGNLHEANRVYDCANQACVISLKLVDIKNKNSIPKDKIIQLNKLIIEILKLRDNLAHAHIAPPVKFEPFVFCLDGLQGIGKSHLLQDLPRMLLDSIGYRSYNEIVYTRTPKNAYWNCLSHQPCVIYDDWYAIDDPEFGQLQVAELFQLKTRAVFNPPMAAVEDKHLRYNPLMVGIGCNNAFPKITGILCEEAVWRRRDVLVHVRQIEAYRGFQIGDIPDVVKKSYAHLEFAFMDPLRQQNVDDAPHMCFQLFLATLVTKFQNYYTEESKVYSHFLSKSNSLYPQDEEHVFKLPNSQFWTPLEDRFREIQPSEDTAKENYHLLVKNYAQRKLNKCKIEFSKFCHKIADAEYVEGNADEVEPEAISPNLCVHNILNSFIEKEPCLASWCELMQAWKLDFRTSNQFDWEELSIRDENFIDLLAALTDESGIRRTITVGYPWLLELHRDVIEHVYDFPKSRVILDYKNGFVFIPHDKCNSKHCKFNSRARFYMTEKFISQNYYLQDMGQLGLSLEGEVPGEFIKCRSGVTFEEIENVGWLKSIWNSIKNTIFSINSCQIYNAVLKISWILMIFGPIVYMCIQAFQTLRLSGDHIKNVTSISEKFDKKFDDLFDEKSKEEILALVAKYGVDKLKLDTKAIAEGFASGDGKVSGGKGSSKSIGIKTLQISQPQVVGNMSEIEFDSCLKVIKRNTFFLSACNNGSRIVGKCLGIFGNWAIVVSHYIEAFKNLAAKNEEVEFSVITSQDIKAFPFLLNELEIREITDCAYCFVKLPIRFPLFKDITSRFATKYHHGYINGLGSVIEISQNSKDSLSCDSYIYPVNYKPRGSFNVKGGIWFSDFRCVSSYCYKGFCGAGKCGSVLLAANLPQPIVGVHVAGSEYEGFSEIIYQETILDLKLSLRVVAPDIQEIAVGDMGHCKMIIDSQVLGLGSVSSKLEHRENTKSRIKPSLVQMYGDFPLYNDIAVLSPLDPRLESKFSPLLEGCRYHGYPLKSFRLDHLDSAYLDFCSKILAKSPPVRLSPGKLTKIQVCNGFDGLDGYDHLEWRTSEGFPFVASRPVGVHDKKWLFNFDNNNKVLGLKSNLIETIKRKKYLRLNNIVPDTIFTDCLKDTTIAKDKVLIPGKTRVFSMAPVDFTIQQRQYTLDFTAAFMKNRLDLEHAVGINPDSCEWGMLANTLLERGENIICADYSKFGDTIPFEFIQIIYKIIFIWYQFYGETNEKFEQTLKIMSYEVGHASHLMLNYVYKCLCGQPSGNALTVIINSMANSLYIRLAWLTIMANTIYSGLDNLHKFVSFFSYGDDIIMSVNSEVCDKFNALTLNIFFAQHNLKFTNADKSSCIVPYCSLSNADFLKRGFKLHPSISRQRAGIMLAPLSIESIEDTINWVWDSGYDSCNERCPQFVEMCKQICVDASRNAWTRGPEYYHAFIQKVGHFWIDFGEFISFPSWSDLDNRVFDHNIKLIEYKSV